MAAAQLVQHIATPPESIAINNEPLNNLVINLPNASLASNCLVCAIAYPSGATPVITDNKSNTWPTSGGAGTVTVDAGGGNLALQVFVLTSAATGTQQVTVGFGSTVQIPVRVWITEWVNVTGTIDGHASAAAVNVSGLVSPGAFTPSAANCLVLSYMADSNTTGTTNPTLIQAAQGYALNDADIGFTTGNGTPAASQWAQQTTAVATTASFMLSQSGAETYNVISLALSTGTQGTAPSPGIHIDRLLYFSTNSVPANYTLQIPSTGNLGVLASPIDLNGNGIITTIDSDGVTWKNAGSAGTPLFMRRENYIPSSTRTVTCQFTNTAQDQMLRYFDISFAAGSPFDVSAFTGATGVNNVNSISSFPAISPMTANGLILACMQNGLGPTLGVTAPTGVVYDEQNYSRAQFVGGITTTTLTVASTTWGTVDNGLEVISGSGVTVGTTVQSGTGPTYTIQPSQTVTAGTTMTQSSNDSSTVNWGNALAHVYNASAGATSFAWSFANQPSNSVSVGAIAFKAGPQINTQPVSPYISPGTQVTFSVTATASAGSLSYQWFRNGSSIGGATSASYTFIPNYPVDYGAIWICTVTDSNNSTNTQNAQIIWQLETGKRMSPNMLDIGDQDFPSELNVKFWF